MQLEGMGNAIVNDMMNSSDTNSVTDGVKTESKSDNIDDKKIIENFRQVICAKSHMFVIEVNKKRDELS